MLTRKPKFFESRSNRVALAVVMVGLVAGLYFLFKPFPAGSSLEVAANVQEKPVRAASRTDFGWNAKVNARSPVFSFESGAPLHYSGKAVSSSAAPVQRLDIGAGYILENGPQGSRLIAPSVPRFVNSSVQRIDIGSGYMLELGPQATGRLIASSVSYAAKSPVQRIDIGGGYMLEFNAQGGKVIAPNTLVQGLP